MTDLTAPAARALTGEWRLALTSERKSPTTIALYLDAVGRYLAWAETKDMPPMRRTTLQTWITDMLDAGRSPSTARIRQQAVRRYAAWLTAVGHLDATPFQGMTSPKLDQPVVDPLTVAEVRALLQTCHPDAADGLETPRSLRHVRDEAIIRLMAETGIRLSEVVALTPGDLDLGAGLVTIRRGKGGRGRIIAVGTATTAAIQDYLAVRRIQPHADRDELWLGERSCGLKTDALYRSLRRRAERAGIDGFRPHLLRHTAAHRWLAAGGSESGLMAMAGWTRVEMLIRYTRSNASERAAAEAHRLTSGSSEWLLRRRVGVSICRVERCYQVSRGEHARVSCRTLGGVPDDVPVPGSTTGRAMRDSRARRRPLMGARPHGVPLAAPRALGQVAHCGPTLNALSNELLSPAKFHKGACTLPGLLP